MLGTGGLLASCVYGAHLTASQWHAPWCSTRSIIRELHTSVLIPDFAYDCLVECIPVGACLCGMARYDTAMMCRV